MKLPQIAKKAAYLAMVYVARKEGVTIEQKYHTLEDDILSFEDVSLTDMIDNLENLYQSIEKTDYEERKREVE